MARIGKAHKHIGASKPTIAASPSGFEKLYFLYIQITKKNWIEMNNVILSRVWRKRGKSTNLLLMARSLAATKVGESFIHKFKTEKYKTD